MPAFYAEPSLAHVCPPIHLRSCRARAPAGMHQSCHIGSFAPVAFVLSPHSPYLPTCRARASRTTERLCASSRAHTWSPRWDSACTAQRLAKRKHSKCACKARPAPGAQQVVWPGCEHACRVLGMCARHVLCYAHGLPLRPCTSGGRHGAHQHWPCTALGLPLDLLYIPPAMRHDT